MKHSRNHFRQRHHGPGRSSGRQVLGADEYSHYRIDGSPDALQAIRSGSLRATTLQPAVFIARLAVDEANQFLKSGNTGKPERQIVPCDLVTQSNVDDYTDLRR